MGRTAGDYQPLHALLDANSSRAGSFKWIAVIIACALGCELEPRWLL